MSRLSDSLWPLTRAAINAAVFLLCWWMAIMAGKGILGAILQARSAAAALGWLP